MKENYLGPLPKWKCLISYSLQASSWEGEEEWSRLVPCLYSRHQSWGHACSMYCCLASVPTLCRLLIVWFVPCTHTQPYGCLTLRTHRPYGVRVCAYLGMDSAFPVCMSVASELIETVVSNYNSAVFLIMNTFRYCWLLLALYSRWMGHVCKQY